MSKLADFWRRQGLAMKIVLGICAAFVGILVLGWILMALGVESGDSSPDPTSSSTPAPSSTTPSPSSTSSTSSSPSSSSSTPAASTSSATPSLTSSSPSSTHATPSSTTSTASSSALALGPKGNYPVEGPMPSPDSNVVGGYECAQDRASLTSDGQLLATGIEPVTTWSVEFDDAQGNPVGDSASGMVGEGDDTISAHATGQGVKYARISASGATSTMCTVIATK